ncbi:MAG TPA: hypothetical protein P5234_02255 [Thermoanaerobaculaceae bacterium]|nr:hypothetical protein [Thermoanaerobaculaceae bacterium]HRS15050.1 hypothetical protein [Thermoanaerobaculaceae bacterium]
MSRSCHLERGGEAVAASWELTPDTLLLSPERRPPEALPLAEVRSVDWDGWSVRLRIGSGEIGLARLGAEADGLVSALRRAWPPLRAAALRVAGDEAPQRFAGSAATPEHREPTPSEILVWPEAVVVAPRGRDLEVLPLAHVAEVAADADAWTVSVRPWDGLAWTFSRLAGDTTRLAEAVAAARAALAVQAGEALAASLPGLDPARRASLAAHWPPGRLLALPALESLAPGFGRALAASWLSSLPRRREGELLLGASGAVEVLLGYRVGPQRGEGEAHEEVEPVPLPADGASVASAAAAPDGGGTLAGADLWAAVRLPGGWLVEDLGVRGVATYVLAGGPELAQALAFWLAATRLPREIVYLGVEALTGERAGLAPAARDLAPLVALRRAFTRRVIHRGFSAWSETIERLLSHGV